MLGLPQLHWLGVHLQLGRNFSKCKMMITPSKQPPRNNFVVYQQLDHYTFKSQTSAIEWHCENHLQILSVQLNLKTQSKWKLLTELGIVYCQDSIAFPSKGFITLATSVNLCRWHIQCSALCDSSCPNEISGTLPIISCSRLINVSMTQILDSTLKRFAFVQHFKRYL